MVATVTELKRELDGDIVVYASYPLARTLIEHDLADELRLFVFPVVLGAGERLFAETSEKKPMRRLATADDRRRAAVHHLRVRPHALSHERS